MAMVPSGGGDESEDAWAESGDVFDGSSSASTPAQQEVGNSLGMGAPNNPAFCVFKGAADGLVGGLMGSVFGFGSGLFKKQGFRGALSEGGSSAKVLARLITAVFVLCGLWLQSVFLGVVVQRNMIPIEASYPTFAILSGVHSIVSCYLKKIRGKEDAWNAGIAGCATGLALSTPGTPQALAQSCLSFGAFSFVLEYMNRTRPAIAATASCDPTSSQPQINVNHHLHLHLHLPVLPPFTLPPLSFVGPLSFLNQEFGRRAGPL